jgi:hypothetical protein
MIDYHCNVISDDVTILKQFKTYNSIFKILITQKMKINDEYDVFICGLIVHIRIKIKDNI